VLGWRRTDASRLSAAVVAAVIGVLAASWYGVWVSGSRSAMLAGAVVIAFVLVRLAPLSFRMPRGRLVAASAVVVMLLGGVLVSSNPSTVGPWQRFVAEAPSGSVTSVRAFLVELWDRNWYGTTAVHMIADSPLVGVGVGAFHLLVPDVGHEHGLGRIEPDNAQNWWRHQVAELGVIGSLGWLVWSVMLVWVVATGRAVDGVATQAGILRGVLVALGLASLLGMPTQNPALALTFWTTAFWYTTLVTASDRWFPPAGRRVWVTAWAVVVLYLGGFLHESWNHLRPPQRASRADWDYSYGFHDPDPHPDGGTFRWAGERGLIVVPLTDRFIEVAAWVNHPDAAERPVSLEVLVDGEPLIDTLRDTVDPITAAVRIPENRLRVTIETKVDRTWSPADQGEADTRQLGPGIRWRFLDP
jgi:hypothetical protein